jgi:hypothetical protein
MSLYDDLRAWHISQTVIGKLRRQHAHFDLSDSGSVIEGTIDEPPTVPCVSLVFDVRMATDVQLGIWEPTVVLHVTAWVGGDGPTDRKWRAAALMSDLQLAMVADQTLDDQVHDVILEDWESINGDEFGLAPGYGLVVGRVVIPYRSEDGSL